MRQRQLEAAVSPRDSGSSGFRSAYRTPRTPIAWRYWLNLSEVELLRACLLSMDINPTDARWWTDADGREHFKTDLISDEETSRDYDIRFALLVDHRKHPEHFTHPTSADGLNTVRLGEFAAWLSRLGFEMPNELATLAKGQQSQMEKTQHGNGTAPTPTTGPTDDPTAQRRVLGAPVAVRPAKRRDLLAPRIEEAQKLSPDPYDSPAVWAHLLVMARLAHPPFVGDAGDEGLKWIANNKEEVQFFKFANLRDRLARQKKAAHKRA